MTGARWARLAAAALSIAAGPVLFWHVLASRRIDVLVELAWLAHRQAGTPFWTDWSLWLTVAEGAVQPSVYLAAAWACAAVPLAGRRAARGVGLGLLAWTLFAAFLTFPPFLDRPDFAPVSWTPFITVLAAGGLPALILIALPRGR